MAQIAILKWADFDTHFKAPAVSSIRKMLCIADEYGLRRIQVWAAAAK
jgi:hypothetical protein